MSVNYQLRITAVDDATKVFKKINASLANTFKPATTMGRQFAAVAKELHVDKIAKGLSGAANASMKFAKGLGLLTAPLEATFSGLMGGTLVGAGVAIATLAARTGAMGFEVNRTSQAIGVSADQLQLWRGIAEKAGLSADAATEALSNLGNILHDAKWNGGPIRTMLAKIGVQIKELPNGAVDAVAALNDIAGALAKIDDPQTRLEIANGLGVTGLLPVLIKGREGVKAYGDEVRATGGIMSGTALKDAEDYNDSLIRLKTTAGALATSLGIKLLPALKFLTENMERDMYRLNGIEFRKNETTGRRDISGSWDANEASVPGGTAAQNAMMAKLEAEKGLPPGLLRGIFGTESSFGKNTGPSSAGARGNFQFMPGTAAQYGVTPGDFGSEATGAANYLSDLYGQTGSWKGALFAYNGVKNNVGAGEKYVNDVAANSGSQEVKISLHITGNTSGIRAQAKTDDGAYIPTRVNYTFPGAATP